MNNQKVLLRIQNLQKYFPMPRKSFFQLRKDYVKANVNVSFDIHEGETVGIVGESGCGKSTLGRTIIQLHKQTGGSSLYYGDSVKDFAPKYMRKIFRSFTKTSEHYDRSLAMLEGLKKAIKTLDEAHKNATKGSEERAELKLKLQDAYDTYRLEKAAFESKFYNTFRLLGGLVLVEEGPSLKKVLTELYDGYARLNKQQRRLVRERAKLKPKASLIETLEENIKDLKKTLKEVDAQVESFRKEVSSHERFQQYESFRDDGIDLSALTRKETRRLQKDLQIIFQDPYSSLDPRMKISDIVGEGLLIHRQFTSSRQPAFRDYVADMLEKCGLERDYLQRYPHQFSGGQRQRIGIARALALKPKFIVCDEAVSALDVSIQSQIINLLQALKEEHNLTYLFITHDLSVVRYISNRIGVMYFGRLVELAPAEEIFVNPQHPYTKQLLNAMPELEDETHQKTMWPITYETDSVEFHFEKGPHRDQDWVEVSEGHYIACTRKHLNIDTLQGGGQG